MKSFVIVALLGTTAAAEPVREEVIGTQPLALVGRGVSASYERRISDRWSAVALGGIRAAALEDYSSRTYDLGGEARYWIRGRTPMRGPFVALHASAAQTRLSDDVMGHIGSSTALSQRVDLGWRFTIHSTISLAPTLGMGTREDIDLTGKLATTIRPQLAIGLELGWLRR
jgi:hypothetical protein